MQQTFKDLFYSKKFWVTIAGAVICTGLKLCGLSDEVVTVVGSLFGVNVLGQGLADFGKNKPR